MRRLPLTHALLESFVCALSLGAPAALCPVPLAPDLCPVLTLIFFAPQAQERAQREADMVERQVKELELREAALREQQERQIKAQVRRRGCAAAVGCRCCWAGQLSAGAAGLASDLTVVVGGPCLVTGWLAPERAAAAQASWACDLMCSDGRRGAGRGGDCLGWEGCCGGPRAAHRGAG